MCRSLLCLQLAGGDHLLVGGHKQMYDPFHEIHLKLDSLLSGQLNLFNELQTLKKGQITMALDITALQAAVANQTTVDASVETLITGMAAQIQTLINASGSTVDPAALQALVNTMTQNNAALQAAVVANTPATPAV